jgi:hypothetical protein
MTVGNSCARIVKFSDEFSPLSGRGIQLKGKSEHVQLALEVGRRRGRRSGE